MVPVCVCMCVFVCEYMCVCVCANEMGKEHYISDQYQQHDTDTSMTQHMKKEKITGVRCLYKF